MGMESYRTLGWEGEEERWHMQLGSLGSEGVTTGVGSSRPVAAAALIPGDCLVSRKKRGRAGPVGSKSAVNF
jgi:hypothetical protein